MGRFLGDISRTDPKVAAEDCLPFALKVETASSTLEKLRPSAMRTMINVWDIPLTRHIRSKFSTLSTTY
jgi:hypothetical protein